MASDKRLLRLKDGRLLTPELERELAEEAERGYDPAKLIREVVGRPSLSGSGASPRVSFRINHDLVAALVRKAAEEEKTVSEVAREAIARYVSP
jgi:hypothetical protein